MLHYNTFGEGQAVFLIHGFPNDGSTWENVIPYLSNQYRFIVPDLAGAGKSEEITNLSLSKMALGLKEILDAEQIDKAIFVGHSMGGYTIMEATQHFAENIKAISLVHSLASADSEEKKEARRKSIRLLQNGDTGKNVFLKAMADNLFAKDFKEKHPEAIQAVVDKGMALSSDVLASFYDAIMHRSDKKEWLKSNTHIPIQWIIGDEDNATPMAEALQQCYLSAINDVQLYKGVGHMSMMETPERLGKDLNQFFDFVCKSN